MKGSVVLAVLSGLLVLLLAHGVTWAMEADGRLAEVISVQGQGEYRPEDVQVWSPALVGQGLFLGNFVRTGDLSRMAILLKDETQVRLNQNSQLQIKNVHDRAERLPAAEPDQRSWTRIRLNQGRAWTQSRRVPEGLIMETPAAFAGIRGTDWEMEVDATGRSTLTVLSGEVDFYNDFGRVTVARGEQAVAEIGKAPVKRLITNPRERVQWVTAYHVDPLRHIALFDHRIEPLKQVLASLKEDDSRSRLARGMVLFDLGEWQQAEVEFQAALGSQPGNGMANLGLAFVQIRRGQIREAREHLKRASRAATPPPGELLALGQAAADIDGQRLRPATDGLLKLTVRPDLAQPAAYLILSDLMIYGGEIDKALEYASQGQRRFPRDDRPRAQLARLYLIKDNAVASQEQIKQALTERPDSIEARLSQGDLALFLGDAGNATAAYEEAVSLKPAEDRGWYGLGVVAEEQEDIKLGRRRLLQAIELNPDGPGYRGELATLETFANHFGRAESEYREALKSNPADYVALTGLGLLQLKRGETETALESFLRASLIEPKYARAHVYAAVAYYQLGQTRTALQELARASELDDKDPFPHQLASMIHSDHFEPGQAVQQAREAIDKLPNLKSLNQIANNQKGTANLGNALAFFGLNDWALNYAQESYYPYWAGSHLFLANRYVGEFNRRSELYQGYITDPTVFGASNRFQTLLPRPGNYLSAFWNAGIDDAIWYSFPRSNVNGLDNRFFPLAYFLEYEDYHQSPRGDFDRLSGDVEQWIGAVGMKPLEDFGLFFFGKRERFADELRNSVNSPRSSADDRTTQDRFDVGGYFNIRPTNQIWFKYGREDTDSTMNGFFSASIRTLANLPFSISESQDDEDIGLRQVVKLSDRAEFSWGLEKSRRKHPFKGIVPDPAFSFPVDDIVRDRTEDRSRNAYVSLRLDPMENLLVQTDLFYQHYSRSQTQGFSFLFNGQEFFPSEISKEHSTSQINPRAGLVYKFGHNQLLRIAYQRWIKPPAIGTLGPVATAGIPLDDEIPDVGGQVSRVAAKLEWEWSPYTFSSLFLNREDISNIRFPELVSFQFPTASIPDIERLQNKGLATINPIDTLEDSPVFSSGEVRQAGLAVNQILSDGWSAFARYTYTDSENTSDDFRGFQLPWLPRHLASFGTTWISPDRLQLSAQAVYRSKRPTEEDNSIWMDAGWDATLQAYWESPDKRFSVSFLIDDLLHEELSTIYRLGLSLRL